MTRKRVPKKGFVYLLESSSIEDGYGDEPMYKYGCTSISPEHRCKRVNYSCKYAQFKVAAHFESMDMFADENKIAWEILDHGLGKLGEIFTPMGASRGEIVNRFKKISGSKSVVIYGVLA